MEIHNFKLLFENAPVLLLVLDTDFKIVAVTNAYLAATMTDRESIIGQSLFDVFPDNPADIGADGVSNLRASLNRVLHYKKVDIMPVQKYDIRKPHPHNDEFEVRYWSPVNTPFIENNVVKFIIHKAEDVTDFITSQKEGAQLNAELRNKADKMEWEIISKVKELKSSNEQLQNVNNSLVKLTEELKRSNADLGQFAATASHDIKAPFRAVGMYLQLIKDKLQQYNLDEEIIEYFEKVAGARNAIAFLIDDLLKFAQVTQANIEFEPVDTKKALDDSLSILDININEGECEIKIEGDFPIINGVYFQIVQLFQNLISNALKFQDKAAPKIVISCVKQKNSFLFSVKDNGIGIDEKYFDKIFKVFERLHNQDDYQGAGLGLAICKRIIENHRGEIWVESVVGAGTTFFFRLPAMKA